MPPGTSLVVQWLRLRAFNAGGVGLIPGRGTKIPHATQVAKKIFFKTSPSTAQDPLRGTNLPLLRTTGLDISTLGSPKTASYDLT